MKIWDQNNPALFWDTPGLNWPAEPGNTQPKIPMAKDQTKRLAPPIIQQDTDTLSGIKGLAPAYAPSDAQYAVTLLTAAQKAMTDAQEAEVQADGVAKTARDAANAAEWAFHNIIQGAKVQVGAQYGKDSDPLDLEIIKYLIERFAKARQSEFYRLL